MATYEKHITQLSEDGDFQLDFDMIVTTPEEAFSTDENASLINKIYNARITFIEERTASNIYGGVAKLYGKVMNRVWVNNVFMRAAGNPGNGDLFGDYTLSVDLDTGDVLPGEPAKTNYIPMIIGGGFSSYPNKHDELYNISVQHDADGNGFVSLRYLIEFSGGATTYNTHLKIEFNCHTSLKRINVHGVPFTEMGAMTKEAIVKGNVAIRTRLVVKNPTNTESTLLLADDIATSTPTNKLVLTEEDAVKTWELNDERYVPENGFIGQFVARTLSGELHNINDDFSIENEDVELQIGVVQLGTQYQWLTTEDGDILIDEKGNRVYIKDLGDDITTWYTLGNFLITKPEDDEVADNTKFEAFDYATKFNISFDANYADAQFTDSFNTLLSNNTEVTAKWLAQYTCTQAGVEFATDTFTNSDFVITSNQFTGGESCRDVMKAISELAFGWCRIGWDNKCYIDEPQVMSLSSDDTNVLTNDNYYSLTTQKEIFGPINRIVIGMSAVDGEDVAIEDSASIEQYGLTEIAIMDNPILYTEDLRNSIIDSGQKLFGLYYSPMETETPGHPWLKGNELIDVQDMEGNSRQTYPFNRTLSYTGHIKSKLITPAPTTQEKTTAYNKTIYKTLRDVGIKVDKQEGIINIVNSNLQSTMDGLSSIERRLDTEITDTYTKTQIQEIINGTAADGTTVTSVKSAAGTFDMNGLTIEQSNADTKTNINADGMKIYNAKSGLDSDPLLDVNSEGMDAENIKVRTYLNIGSHSRMEDYTDPSGETGTGIFWIGGGY